MSDRMARYAHRRRRQTRLIKPGDLPSRFVGFFDGACEPTNPGGAMGFGALLQENGSDVWSTSGFVEPSDATSNNVAEYLAVLAILDHLEASGHAGESVILFGDSRLVIEQLFGRWKIHGVDVRHDQPPGLYAPFAVKAREQARRFPRLKGFWLPREENARADDLSKNELRKRGIEFRIQPEEYRQ